jgi:hypothetical protein
MLEANHLHLIHFQEIRRQPDTKSLATANGIFGNLWVFGGFLLVIASKQLT